MFCTAVVWSCTNFRVPAGGESTGVVGSGAAKVDTVVVSDSGPDSMARSSSSVPEVADERLDSLDRRRDEFHAHRGPGLVGIEGQWRQGPRHTGSPLQS